MQVVVVDEADECWAQQRDALNTVLAAACSQEERPSMVFSGATIADTLYSELIQVRLLSKSLQPPSGRGATGATTVDAM